MFSAKFRKNVGEETESKEGFQEKEYGKQI